MDKSADIQRSVNSAVVSVDTAIALIEQGGGQGSFLDGYTAASMLALLRDSKKKLELARQKSDLIASTVPSQRRTA